MTQLSVNNLISAVRPTKYGPIGIDLGSRSVKLHHVGWNWDIGVTPAALAGVFVLDLTATVGKSGDTFTGRYVTDSYDLDGVVIPAFHAEGVIEGKRIRVN